MSNHNFHRAKQTKNDEFYTQYNDIERELVHYKEYFKDKVVYCNCDADWSNFVKFFNDVKDTWGIKKLLTNSNDFRSPEAIAKLQEADIVVTNPPFSLFREYIAQLMKYDKKFLVIGNMGAVTYKEIFPLIKDDALWLGTTQPKVFIKPDGSTSSVNAVWFTNLTHNKCNKQLKLGATYNEIDYPKYDNYDAIEVSKVANIPCDYYGAMGVPITFLGKYNPEQFEIIKFRRGDDEKDLSINGHTPYFRIIIKRVQNAISP